MRMRNWVGIILLLVSGAVSAYLGEPGTAIVLVLLVLFNTAIGFAQEFRAGDLRIERPWSRATSCRSRRVMSRPAA